LVKAGDVAGASKIPKGTLGTSTGVAKNADNELSLIDLDPEPSSNGNQPESGGGGQPPAAEGDLLGLSFQDEPHEHGGGIFLSPSPGPGMNSSGILPLATFTIVLTARPASFQSPSVQPSGFSARSPPSSNLPSQTQTPVPISSAMQKPAPTPPVDPFASLMSGASQTSSGFNQLQSSHISSPASSSLLDLGPSPAHQAPQTTPAPTASAGDDEWTFTSALPEDVPIAVLNSSVKIEFSPRRNPGDNNIHVAALFSNTTAQPINELHFQLAIEKV
jgi:hypothetical protein